MINFLLGAPGGGKSYEAVVYHIIPALQKGRKVITNLPLDLEQIGLIESAWLNQIEIRTKTLAVRPEEQEVVVSGFLAARAGVLPAAEKSWNNYPFSHVEDYGDPWRHPDNGSGPLYVIDECHIALPRLGTPRVVEEWYSLHRHESADVLLITQSHGKVNKAICDLTQIVYRVRKNVAFGSSGTYVRKVQDGLRGDVVNTNIRKYESRFFKLYRSHTRGGGSELAANDIVPFWKRWPVIGAAIFLSAAVVMGFMGLLNPFKKPPEKQEAVKPAAPQKTLAEQGVAPIAPGHKQDELPQTSRTTPLDGLNLHQVGMTKYNGKTVVYFKVSQGGVVIFTTDSRQLEDLGYFTQPMADCFSKVAGNDQVRLVRCDAPQVSLMAKSPQQEEEPRQQASSRSYVDDYGNSRPLPVDRRLNGSLGTTVGSTDGAPAWELKEPTLPADRRPQQTAQSSPQPM